MDLLVSQSFLTLYKAVAAALVLRYVVTVLRRPKYLPGPRGLPIVGNLFQIPPEHSWELYAKWRDTYGDAIYVTAMGNPIVVLNSHKACMDLLERRSNLYSDRPVSIVASKLMGWSASVTLGPYDDRWRRFRRIMAQAMKKGTGDQAFLGSLLAEPDKFLVNFRFGAGRNLLKSLYGIDVEKANDPIILAAEEAMQYVAYSATPGTFLVDFFPILHPSWFPGAGFKKFVEKGKAVTIEMADLPLNKTKADMATGRYEPSFSSTTWTVAKTRILCDGALEGYGRDDPRFLMAMVLYPDVQKRAQAELDTFVGTGRLPTIEDRPDLPYVNAVMKEVMRWQPVAPLALPHRLTHDDIYKGCFLPAGCTVLGNTWAITRDTALYPDPERFNPDRFLPLFDKSIKVAKLPLDPVEYVYGFGRRICGGMNYADTMVFLTMASILSAFDMRPAKDEAGREIPPEMKFNSNILREAIPFKYAITPRAHAVSVVSAAQVDL
ncbi:cytochrome P450 [Infundibulicybe gibba]|nr:cytochrome P450 [Infundibulicybe gibba]